MELSIEDAVAYARRIYVNKEKPEAIAKELSVTPQTMHAHIRLAFPRLISEEDWDISAVIEHMGGRHLPLEMRKEIQKLVKKHGLNKAVKLTTCSVGSAARWGRGELGESGVLEMGKLPWKSLLTGTPAKTDRSHPLSKASNSDKRQAVYRMLTERPDLDVLASDYKVTVTSLYNWRMELVGKSGVNLYKPNCEAFIAKFAAEAGKSPKALIVKRKHQVSKKTPTTRKQYSQTFKREAVNRFENHNEPAGKLTESLGISENILYTWRVQILGKSSSKQFASKARELAQEFIEEAQVDDVVTQANGLDHEPEPELQRHPSSISYAYAYERQPQALPQALPLDSIEAVVAHQPAAILASIEQIDREIMNLQKDRQLQVQHLEIQRLRRALSQSDG